MSTSKVCLLTSGHSPFDVRIFHKEAKTLTKAGYEVVIIVPHEGNDVVEGVRILGLPKPTSRAERLLLSSFRVLKLALREKGKVYHFYNPELIPYALLIRLFGKIVIYDVLEDFPKQMSYKQWIPCSFRGVIAWLFEHLEQFAAQRFSAIVAAGLEVGERLRSLNQHTVVVQNFPLLEELLDYASPGPSGYTGKAVVNLGGVSRERAIISIVQAMGLLPSGLGARLILGGRSDSETLQEVSRMPGWKRVDYRGVIPRQEANAILVNAAVALVLYSPEPNHLDVRSNRFYESLGAGVPVITPNFPRWREIVEGNGCGLTVEPLNPEAIAEAIEYLLTHPEEAAEMGHRGRQAVLEKFNWTKEQVKLLQLYEELLSQSKD